HIAVSMPDAGMGIAARLGSRAFAHSAALGKALLATMSDEDVRKLYVSENLAVSTPTTIPTVTALLAELENGRARCSAPAAEESRAGIFCIGVPVFGPGGQPVFAISVTTVPNQSDERRDQLVKAVQAAASLATTSFGGRDGDWRTRTDEQHDGDAYAK